MKKEINKTHHAVYFIIGAGCYCQWRSNFQDKKSG